MTYLKMNCQIQLRKGVGRKWIPFLFLLILIRDQTKLKIELFNCRFYQQQKINPGV